MSDNKPYTLASGDKATIVMAYTANSLVRGEVITKEFVRVSTWLRTQGAPEYIQFFNAQVLLFSGSAPAQNLTFRDLVVPAATIIGYHIAPPAKDPVDYDETERNRKMEPLTILIGSFRFNGFMRISSQATIAHHLDIAHETLASVYEIDISNPSVQSMAMHIPMMLVRPNLAMLGSRT